mmetsp:Transcript_50809/g.128135  ORF Transcript_50809/g.128135 Transcript_50809/m.128135 type:complete len:151 (+) Transcript_50809:68-520(+)
MALLRARGRLLVCLAVCILALALLRRALRSPEEGEITSEETSLCTSSENAKKWKAKGYPNFLEDMDSCGRQCMGRLTCATKCIRTRNGYTEDCATCFGTMISCTASKCWAPCMKGGDQNPACRACTRKKCRPAFEACSGITKTPEPEEAK